MQPYTVISKMEEYVQDFRAQLEKKDFASVPTLISNMRSFFAELEGKLPEQARMEEQFSIFRECADRFGKACVLNDVRDASQALTDMESAVRRAQSQLAYSAAL